ncbi:hypothetical protein N8J89_30980 [Crossiella sp. CA-258035]|uniref:DUF6801 domain-containing protein n=1 Tax=Crossiella sp. CA-258035 TaxID=2981138 RepID=UPI0024BCAF84|nr:DUF6801 domain-containing protein [Crossiella sp. CA-258035]WHT17525.1 hypothetical protein N8J89_30980 [Crossiella sp. CA-258035]
MTRTGSAHRLGALAAAALLVPALGVSLVGDGSAAAESTARRIAYTCTAPELTAQAVVTEVAGVFPASGSVGAPVQSALTVTATLPETVLPALGGAKSVIGTAALGLAVNGAGLSAAVTAEELGIPATEVPEKGELKVVATGKAPALTPAKPGDLTVTATELSLTLGSATDDGPPLNLKCAKDEGQDAQLVKLPVTGRNLTTVPGASGTLPVPTTGGKPVPSTGSTVPGAGEDQQMGPLARRIRYKVDGVSRIKKMESEVKIGPGEMLTEVIIKLPVGEIKGDLTLPPSKGYFVLFRFVPNNSVIEFESVGQVAGIIERGQVKATSKMFIKLRDIKVGGVPLDVGPNCKTVEPAVIDLVSAPPPPPFLPTRPTPMSATYTIPPFGNCGVTEPLDSLLTGLISGPGNTLNLTLTFLGYE